MVLVLVLAVADHEDVAMERKHWGRRRRLWRESVYMWSGGRGWVHNEGITMRLE